ncbi:MAG: alpha/beta fold hydrolase [Spirosomataceae bacterium]
MMGRELSDGILIDTVFEHTTFDNAGIRKGDRITAINDVLTTKLSTYNMIASTLRTDDEVKIKYIRENKEATVSTKAVMKPYETSSIADLHYDWVKFKNGYLRAITYQPKGQTNLPAILLIPGYGCGSIENYTVSYNGKLINEWLKNGFAVVTIEKSGIGDGQGCASCNEVDLVTDIESFDAGYAYMEQLSYVDKTRLFIWGHSMGGTIAPKVAQKHSPRGVMVFACVFRPWNEFLLEMHRVQKPLMEGMNYLQTEKFVRGIQPIYHEFFNSKKSPQQLFENPAYRPLVESELGYKEGSSNMWGRHWKFWQQLDSLNLAESWQQVDCPVLILHGGADYEQCSLVEPFMIKETINEKHPKTATWITIPDIDHFMMRSNDWTEAYEHFKNQAYTKGNFNIKIAEETLKWLKMIK